jgi:hypothetical protein
VPDVPLEPEVPLLPLVPLEPEVPSIPPIEKETLTVSPAVKVLLLSIKLAKNPQYPE